MARLNEKGFAMIRTATYDDTKFKIVPIVADRVDDKRW
jgi:Holliday junction resolvase